MPGRDGTGPMGNGSVGGRGGMKTGRGQGCQNGAGRNNRFANNRMGAPYCWKWDNTSQDNVSVLKNQAEYYEKQLESINQQLSAMETETKTAE
ncbi:DUF5320 domain-containing protein [Acetobacterium bakii]|uniref:Uncharacterized protein n=1 Tax=Acetobacterium bakii TaxID=52689 RepID=A0A0L6U038_9FIRM|nr:DUF5320 domain-containing protein [Acetobacterium bakii]KNZ41717.1 hypothetical protein AKG39_10325 [Acetobacterium bakii]